MVSFLHWQALDYVGSINLSVDTFASCFIWNMIFFSGEGAADSSCGDKIWFEKIA